MKRFAGIALALAALAGAAPALAKPATDCPLRDAPFSADSPLIDLLLSPAAKAVIQKEGGASFDKAPPQFAGTTPPTFAAILTYREAGAAFMKQDAATIDKVDAALRKLKVSSSDKRARCARYDVDAPRFVLPEGKPKLLLFEKINGFKDVPSFDAAHAAFLALARDKGWSIVSTDRGGAFTPAILAQFDAVIWNNISGDVLTLSQRAAFQDYMEKGGGFIGVHGSAGDPVYFWDWYADSLIGARFMGHPMNPQFQDAWVNADPTHPIAKGLPTSWLANDEWYSFKTNPRATGARIVATLRESSYDPVGHGGQDLRMGADHPLAWTRCIGQGRMFYSAMGHLPERYSDPEYRRILTQAVGWVSDKTVPCATR
jgi:type 1 glutamine amidotransferase